MAEGTAPQDSKYLHLPFFCEIPYQQIASAEVSVPKRIIDKWDDICNAIKSKNVLTNQMIVFCGNFHFVPTGSTPSGGNWLLWGIIAPQYNNAGTIFATHYGGMVDCYMIKKDDNSTHIYKLDTTTIQ